MAYDPCAPRVLTVAHRRAVPHVLGRRIAHWHGPKPVVSACRKVRPAVLLPRRLSRLDPLVIPGMATVAAMGVLGVTAFGPSAAPPSTVAVVGHSGGTPPVHSGTGTSVPEPGTAAILAVAMVVVMISSWLQGGRAFRRHAQSTIVSTPLPSREHAPDRAGDGTAVHSTSVPGTEITDEGG